MRARRRLFPRSAAAIGAFLLAALSGCSTAPKWPAPHETGIIVLDPLHRRRIVRMALGNAVRFVLPPPAAPGTQWQVLLANIRVLRQMTPIQPDPARPGSFAVTFQAIHVTPGSLFELAALPPNPQGYAPEDLYAFSLTVVRSGE